MPIDDFNGVVHALRTTYLERMPAGAQVLVSAGCSGRWYFDWINDHYGRVSRHYGVEAYSPQPAELPDNAVWLPETLDAMGSIPDGSADLVFAGQTVEHLWPAQLAGFLLEARRVLRPGGWLVMDSPNRLITQMTRWYQPQHTAELRVDEISRLTTLAGFDVERIKGLWLCYDRDRHALHGFEPTDYTTLDLTHERRALDALDRPEDSFIWWLEASPSTRPPRPKAELEAEIRAIYQEAFDAATIRWWNAIGRVTGHGRNRLVSAGAGEAGYLLYGPYVPLQPGTYRVSFFVGLSEPGGLGARSAVLIDVTCDQGTRTLASRQLATWRLPHGRLRRFDLTFSSKETLFGVEFRVFAHGHAAVVVRAPVDVVDQSQWVAVGMAPTV